MEYLPTSFIHVIKTWKFLILSAFIVCYLYRFAYEQILGLNSFVSAADMTETFSMVFMVFIFIFIYYYRKHQF